jgi:hypothetical protein
MLLLLLLGVRILLLVNKNKRKELCAGFVVLENTRIVDPRGWIDNPKSGSKPREIGESQNAWGKIIIIIIRRRRRKKVETE